MDLILLFLITSTPFIAFLKISALPKRLKKFASLTAISGIFISFLSTLLMVLRHPEIPETPFEVQWTWMVSGSFTFNVGFLLDRLNVIMLFVVILVSLFVQIFSVSYMAEEGRGKARYFAFLSFFSFSMINLVVSNNLLQTFIFWELVGLASYLLIGYWYEKPSAALASRKAFVVTRLGDLGFYLAVALLILNLENLNFSHLNSTAIQSLSLGMITLITLLIFSGIMGKSAQFPLHIWLPDAMEGPTPVSALIHSATMVAAGVFLTARTYALFSASEITLSVILILGTLTALVGATLAVVQNDIKRILAYSTISQLGLMMMALGAGSYEGGIFHLATHAFFKSLLFLSAGSLIHHFHTNDIWDMAKKGSRSQGLTLIVLFVGGLSLAGVFPFSGFWSKDLILEALHAKPVFYYAALVVSFFTSYYVFRLLFILYFRSDRSEPAHHDSSHEGGILKFCMNFPLISLAVISVIVGFMGTGLMHHALLKYITPQAHGEFSLPLAITGTAVALAGLIGAYWVYLKKQAQPPQTAKGIRKVLDQKYYMDFLFEKVFGRTILALSSFFNWFDKQMINAKMVNGTAWNTFRLGGLLSKIQTGELQDYLMILFFIGSALIFFLLGST